MALFGSSKDRMKTECNTNDRGEVVCTITSGESRAFVKYVVDKDGVKHPIAKSIDAPTEAYRELSEKIEELLK